ncbi:dicarboxylate/amino acid:cation symporter [Oceanispirochaeta sp.]|uniref:dicarboxylate/amino acid:cation symporter n=1 Tax=Oceanispirochaeta sp. TaxID=2035350 RepID=UPI00262B8C5F|nr:dicarboxylate/amino acid:cation symporter [Oceanispirochaeta sp.]MDA3958614.1 dicarboxylate/amino acid:cation symporter [Oceanispirochaeta sp.]
MRASKKKGLFAWYFNTSLLLRIFIGLMLGAIIGIVFGPSVAVVQPLGSILVNLLKMIVMPLILTSLVVGAASIQPKELGKIGIRIFIYYIVTSALAVSIGLIAANIFNPGAGLELAVNADIAGKALNQPKFMDTFLNIIPKNPFGALSQGQVLPIIFFALTFGIGISVVRNSEEERIAKAGETLFSIFDGAAEVMYVIVRWILEYAPIGVFALIAVVFGKQGASAFGSLGLVTLTAYVGFFIQIALVYGFFLVVNKLSYLTFFKGAREAMVTAFVTRSSSGTLPITMRNMNENLGVPKKIASFTLPLGATINMDGTAIYMGVCALFITNAVGMDLNLTQQFTIILTAVLASIGSAGIPGAGAIMLLMVLNSIGITIEAGSAVAAAYAMILGIDALLDMGRTITNVTGDMVGTVLVSKGEKELDLRKWK